MKPSEILTLSFEDIIFRGRNKLYGAYDLRMSYERHMRRGLAWGLFVFLLLVSTPKIFALFSTEEEMEIICYCCPCITDVDLPPKKEESKEIPTFIPPPPPPPKSTIAYLPPVIKADDLVDLEAIVATIEDLGNFEIGTKTLEGSDDGIAMGILEDYGDGDFFDSEVPVVEVKKKQDPEVFMYVEQMPVFGSGIQELMEYLSSRIKYPDLARSAGIEGTVVIQFVVNPQGKVTDVTLVRGIGGGCDELAVKIVSNMPDWSPGKQQGRAVPVKMTLPIKFNLK